MTWLAPTALSSSLHLPLSHTHTHTLPLCCSLEELQGLLLRFDFNDFYAGGGAAAAAAREGAASGEGSDRE